MRIAIAACALAVSTSASVGEGLEAEWLYNGVGRPVMIRLDARADRGDLVLLDADGRVLAGPAPMRTGRADLAELMPEIAALRRAAWLQAIVDGAPSGPPLVVQPMLSREVPIVEEAINPNGIRYTRIVGWYDELHPPTPPADDGAGAPEGDLAAADDAPAPSEPSGPAPPPRAEPLFTGLRIYRDADVVLRTSEGDLRLALRPDAAPNTAWNFRTLAAGGFYRDIAWHRIVPLDRNGDPFVIQAGDPSGTGDGGPGYWLPMERSTLPHDFGVISMARDVDPDSAGSQIFICLSRAGTARLDGHYCAFGETVDGAATIERLAGVELADVATGRPVSAPRILDAELVPAPPRAPNERRRPVAARPAPAEPERERPGRVDR